MLSLLVLVRHDVHGRIEQQTNIIFRVLMVLSGKPQEQPVVFSPARMSFACMEGVPPEPNDRILAVWNVVDWLAECVRKEVNIGMSIWILKVSQRHDEVRDINFRVRILKRAANSRVRLFTYGLEQFPHTPWHFFVLQITDEIMIIYRDYVKRETLFEINGMNDFVHTGESPAVDSIDEAKFHEIRPNTDMLQPPILLAPLARRNNVVECPYAEIWRTDWDTSNEERPNRIQPRLQEMLYAIPVDIWCGRFLTVEYLQRVNFSIGEHGVDMDEREMVDWAIVGVVCLRVHDVMWRTLAHENQKLIAA
jgi:hypothetical protein